MDTFTVSHFVFKSVISFYPSQSPLTHPYRSILSSGTDILFLNVINSCIVASMICITCEVNGTGALTTCAAFNALFRSLICSSMRKPGLKLCAIIRAFASITVAPARPPRIAWYTSSGSAPLFTASVSASETAAIFTAQWPDSQASPHSRSPEALPIRQSLLLPSTDHNICQNPLFHRLP